MDLAVSNEPAVKQAGPRTSARARRVLAQAGDSDLQQIVDVDEWLYRANRVRAFTPGAGEYVPRHRAEATAF